MITVEQAMNDMYQRLSGQPYVQRFYSTTAREFTASHLHIKKKFVTDNILTGKQQEFVPDKCQTGR
jgi:hypothetical protein